MTTAAAEEMDLILCAVCAGGCGSCHVGRGSGGAELWAYEVHSLQSRIGVKLTFIHSWVCV